MKPESLVAAREAMVRLLLARGIRDPRILAAFRAVPRELFVPAELTEFAYEDAPLPIEEGQTISQPYIVALMAEALQLQPTDRVLEIGAGSGYAAAILGARGAQVREVAPEDRKPLERAVQIVGPDDRDGHRTRLRHGSRGRLVRLTRRLRARETSVSPSPQDTDAA